MEVKGQAGSTAVKAAVHTSEDPVSTKGRPYPENSLIWLCADRQGEGKTAFKMPGLTLAQPVRVVQLVT